MSRVVSRARISASAGRRWQGSTTKAHSQCVEEEDAASGVQSRRNTRRISGSGHLGEDLEDERTHGRDGEGAWNGENPCPHNPPGDSPTNGRERAGGAHTD